MQHIAQHLRSSGSAPSPSQEPQPTTLGPNAMRTFWVRMAEIYGHKWTSAYGDDSGPEGAAGTWAKGLAGVTPAQVSTGLQACLVAIDPWPPTLPEFRAMCLGVPTFAAVRADADKVKPFTVLVWQHLDGYLYKNASADKADKMLKDAYELAREHVMKGGALPEPASGAIEQERKKWEPPPAETREEIIRRAQLEAGLGE